MPTFSTSTIVVSVPHIGLTENSARGFALDQFARQQGYSSLAEWTVHCFDQGLQIYGKVQEADVVDVAHSCDLPGSLSKTFGYKVVVHLKAIDGGI